MKHEITDNDLNTGKVLSLVKLPLTNKEEKSPQRDLILTFRIAEALVKPRGPFLCESEIVKVLKEHNL